MNVYPAKLIIHGLIFLLTSCASFVEPYDLVFRNVSDQEISEVYVIWDGDYYSGGIVVPNKNKSVGALQHHIPETAKLFWENAQGAKREKELEVRAGLPKLGEDKEYHFYFEIDQETVRLVVKQDENLATWLEKNPEFKE